MLSAGDILKRSQKGLFFSTPDFGSFAQARYKPTIDHSEKDFQNKVIRKCRNVLKFAIGLETKYPNARARAIVGFDPADWKLWNPGLEDLEQRPEKFLIETSTKFLQTGGDLFFFIKAEERAAIKEIEEYLKQEMEDITVKVRITKSSPSSKRILQRCFEDGLINAADAQSLNTYTVIAENSKAGRPGGTYMMTQKFEFDWLVLGNMCKSEKEDMIGRRMMTNSLIPNQNPRSHIFRAHFIPDEMPMNSINRHRVMFRQSLPYGVSDTGNGREEGIFYLSFSNTTSAFQDVLESIVGNDEPASKGEVTVDMLMNVVKPLKGTWWYVPSAKELGMESAQDNNFDLKEHWNIHSTNPYMFYNQNEYLYRMTCGDYKPGDEPSPRVLKLIAHAFLHWNDQWFRKRDIPPMQHLESYLKPEKKYVMTSSVMIRKAWATKISLKYLFTSKKVDDMESSEFYGRKADLFEIHPDEIIVGKMPNHSLGLGKVTMPYLCGDNEKMDAFLKGLSENAATGHVVPNIQLVLDKGIGGLIEEITHQMSSAEPATKEHDFLKACIISLKGVQGYIRNYGRLAKHLASLEEPANAREYRFSASQKANLGNIAERMDHISSRKPTSFVEAVQLVFSIHCCLHLVGDPTSIGRLDQLLQPFIGDTSEVEAQEIIDCFFVKVGERVQYNKTLLVDRNTWGTCAVPYRSDGLFPNGDSINQWVQQMTLGGYQPDGQSACNQVTLWCLKAARRLPLNSPCVSLRVHHGIEEKYLREAAKSILSGGAHPIILQDDRLVGGLLDVLHTYKSNVTEQDKRNAYDLACDGCYEPIIAGCTEFAFTYVPLLQIIEMAINEGATYISAGPSYLNGTPQSQPTEPASGINLFDRVLELFKFHFEIKTQQGLIGLLSNYGNISSACPSPLLSSLIAGCLETQRDITDGGALYKMISVMHVGFANAVDSLYAIKKLCFDQGTSVLSLDEMVACLKSDWGSNIQEPVHDSVSEEIRRQRKIDFYKHVRDLALQLPKFGTAEAAEVKDIKKISDFIADLMATTMKNLTGPDRDKHSPLSHLLDSLMKKYSKPGFDFEILFTPGSGTFEGYVGWGLSCAASADGRRHGMPLASDMSAAPSPQDLPFNPKDTELYQALSSWDKDVINKGVVNGAEIDLKIREEFKEDDLVTFLTSYAEEKQHLGGNILTVTCANTDTYAAAVDNPEKYNLLRVRTGGWSEFFISFFKAHQEHHLRRTYYHVDGVTA